jgi:hypothetical protein
MITIRFPDGTAVSYAQAVKVTTTELGHQLLDTENRWVALVTLNCSLEAVLPSSLSNPIKQPSAMIRWVMEHLREMPASSLAQLKSALNDFDSRKRIWK